MSFYIVLGAIAVAAAIYFVLGRPSASARVTTPVARQDSSDLSYLEIPLKDIHGKPAKLSDYKGKVMLLVNVASECGYTPQYEGLEKLYEKYQDKGLVIIGFPANNFGEQEPGTNDDILTFCKANYGVTFPMMAKISAKGGDIHPLYDYLTRKSPFPGDITWNFNKFMIDKSGHIAARFDKKAKPEDPEFVGKIEELLK